MNIVANWFVFVFFVLDTGNIFQLQASTLKGIKWHKAAAKANYYRQMDHDRFPMISSMVEQGSQSQSSESSPESAPDLPDSCHDFSGIYQQICISYDQMGNIEETYTSKEKISRVGCEALTFETLEEPESDNNSISIPMTVVFNKLSSPWEDFYETGYVKLLIYANWENPFDRFSIDYTAISYFKGQGKWLISSTASFAYNSFHNKLTVQSESTEVDTNSTGVPKVETSFQYCEANKIEMVP